MDFLKNLKLENKSKAYTSSNKSSFIGGSSEQQTNQGTEKLTSSSNQDYADHLIEH